MSKIRIRSALVSVYHKNGLDDILHLLEKMEVTIYSTGGTYQFIQGLGIPVVSVEQLTGFAEILDGRVKTLHPKVFGGILARRDEGHLAQLEAQEIPEIDLVIVDLYPFEKTVQNTTVESEIIEKIDIGGISLIRAAAKNYKDVLIVPSQEDYAFLHELLVTKEGYSDLADRKFLATRAFQVSSHYDTQIFRHFNRDEKVQTLVFSAPLDRTLRYGENPHQAAGFYGHLDRLLQALQGKELSYNNLVDVDAAIWLMKDMDEFGSSVAILKHTNVCGMASRDTLVQAWTDALAGDPVSAFGGVIITNRTVDEETASAIDHLFYEVLIAPDFDFAALRLLQKKKNRILLKLNQWPEEKWMVKSLLNGLIRQERDLALTTKAQLKSVTVHTANEQELTDLVYANRLVKHLKSNAITLVKNKQLIGMGCGQTSRVDALKQAIGKARHFGFSDLLAGSAMASEAFFPFPDCVEIAHEAGIRNVVQPGGSVKDQESIDFCQTHGMAMYLTGIRHFKH
ncbi:MAG TPA: bifunctional phosphoribosylaminoimidazolecarboxamide formyltransferase/IMP cyclohydrolase [Saprospiraceae bacterium]|nr:bifunctional phosphoribosylaminoimidazolecarboxamide formyltransferase/IMP cyclohydrolase [Saprospiraceae bacterium]HNT21718.1 bifunctional phosphoribosylaminoimidazolecarboxamide formyltransferase/IMP cyclohydrolase [Saprospiraceae bacterium]